MTNSATVWSLMFRTLFLLLLCITVSIAEGEYGQMEVTAKNVHSTRTTITGTGGVVVYYNNAVIRADKAVYNRESKLLVLDGRVEMIGYKGSKEQTNHMEIQTESNEIKFDELFLVSKNDVWLYAQNAHKVDGNYTLVNSMLSSCDADNPLWKMTFKDSLYDSNAEYMKLYDAKMYFLDVPVAYTPYMGFSTNKKRSSGLLFPLFGYSNEDGMVYEQPIFWAISDSMDLEFNPQIRTNRSIGGYATYRFVDSPVSSGALRVGYFKDNDTYTQEHNLPNSSHYGVEFNYETSKLFSGAIGHGVTDGLYINSTFLNDVDYLYLQKTSLKHFGYSPIQQSLLNYFLHNDDYYAGVNAKYFIDTRKVDNDDTLQVLPSIQLHKYLKHFIVDNFTYNIDVHINNYDRKKGATQQQVEMRIPLEFTTSFFDDYVSLSLGEELYYSKYMFGNGQYTNDEYQYYSNFHRAKLFTDLTKKYDGFVHVLQPSVEYFKPGSENEKPLALKTLLDTQLPTEPSLSDLPFATGIPEESYMLRLSQFFYDDAMKLKFFQRISQIYYTEREYEFSDILNEMQYNLDKWSFYNNIIYSTEYSYIRESSSTVSLKESEYSFSLGHSYKQVLKEETETEVNPDFSVTANDVYFRFGYTYNSNIGFTGALTYNIEEAESRQWVLGGSYKVDCWSMSASARRDIIPRASGEPTTTNAFYLQLNFIPFGGIGLSSAGLANGVY